MKAQKGIKRLDPLFNHGARWGVGGQRHAPQPLYPVKDARYPWYRRRPYVETEVKYEDPH